MSLFGPITKSGILKAAIKQVAQARVAEGSKAEQLFKSAYQGFAKVIAGDLNSAEALYNWGFALLHEAKSKSPEQAKALYLDAISKFAFCSLASPTHLGAAIDGGVALMDLARLNDASADDSLYDQALVCFNRAENIQKGSAAYNLACIYALRGDQDACLASLELSRDRGSLPDEQDVMNDPDMAKVKDAGWFHEFLGTVKVALVETAENDKRTRRGLKEVEEVKLDLPPRPTDSTLKRHYDAMIAAELEKQQEILAQKKQEAEEKAKKKKGEQFNYYK